jgi:hypothetical protein
MYYFSSKLPVTITCNVLCCDKIIIFLIITNDNDLLRVRGVNASASYSGWPGFISRPGNR